MIREALLEDRHNMVAMAKRFHLYAKMPFDFNPAHAERTARWFILDDAGIALVVDIQGCVYGMLCAHIHDHPFWRIKVAEESLWWHDLPAKGHAKQMLAEYERVAKSRGAQALGLSLLPDSPMSLVKEAGYRVVNLSFMKVLD